MKKFLMLHGVNHNMFGKREPKYYGTVTLDEINQKLSALGKEFLEKVDGVIINAGAWTHYSYGLRDALAILTVPIVEIHMSNNHVREEFRQYSVISPIAKGYIAGFGIDSYLQGLRAAVSASAAAKT